MSLCLFNVNIELGVDFGLLSIGLAHHTLTIGITVHFSSSSSCFDQWLCSIHLSSTRLERMATGILSVSSPHQLTIYKSKAPHSWLHSSTTVIRFTPKTTYFVPLSSSSSSSGSIVEDDLPSPLPEASTSVRPESFRGCNGCGKEEIERGCNGEGRIQGGIGTVPGFGWWPIKAYRPCPGFLASGGRYRRQGQSMDEVAFGRGPTKSNQNDQSG
ncbi:hypothetical protein ACFE04_007637 [Oxalis oulophora]